MAQCIVKRITWYRVRRRRYGRRDRSFLGSLRRAVRALCR